MYVVFLLHGFNLRKRSYSCVQGTQRGSGTSHSSSSSQVDSSPKLQHRQRTGLRRTVAAVGQTEPVITQQSSSTELNNPTFSTAAEISKLSPLRNGSMSLDCDSPKDRDFPHDFPTSSLHVDVGSTVQDFVDGCDGSSSHLVVSGRGNGQPCLCTPAFYCKLHRRKTGRRPQSASDIDRCQSAADCHFVGSSESMSTLEEQFNKTLEMNMKLAEKLATTCQQMEVLTAKLRKFEVCRAAFHYFVVNVKLKIAYFDGIVGVCVHCDVAVLKKAHSFHEQHQSV